MTSVKKLISFGLSGALFLSNGVFAYSAETNLWQSRRNGRQLASAAMPALPAIRPGAAIRSEISTRATARYTVPAVRKAFAAVPRTAATIRNVLIPARPNGKVVVYIQDVHGNNEAQDQIAATVTALTDTLSLKVLALEGAFGPIDVKPFQTFPKSARKTDVVARLLKEHLVTGPIAASWNAADTLTVTGVDNAAFHRKNVAAYLQSRGLRPALRERWTGESAALQTAKHALFNSDLAAFDAVVGAYQAGTLPLSAYARELEGRIPRRDGTLSKFLAASDLEKALDFKRVESERRDVLRRLVSVLTDKRAGDLIDLGLAYRSGQISAAEFNAELTRFCVEAGVPLSSFPELSRYLTYVRASDEIDAERLSEDLASTERQVFASLARTPEETELLRKARALHLAGKLLDFGLSREEWRDYLSVRGKLADWDLKTFEAFYEAAESRDADMAGGVMRALQSSSTDTAALVTGGFHSSGVERRLVDAGYSVIRVTPRLTRADDGATLVALSVFAQEKTPLEKIFEGRALFLSPDPFPLQARRVAALELSASEALANASPAPAMIAWLATALPWTNIQAAIVDGRWAVSGAERHLNGQPTSFAVAVDVSGAISIRGSPTGDVLVRPFIETAGLLVALTAAHAVFPGLGIAAQVLVGILFAAIHPSVYERDANGRFNPSRAAIRFLTLALLGTGFTALLAGNAGFVQSFVAHAAYNASVIFAGALINAGFTSRAVGFIAALPLAAVKTGARPTRTFTAGGNNTVPKIIKGHVVLLDGAEYAKKHAPAEQATAAPDADMPKGDSPGNDPFTKAEMAKGDAVIAQMMKEGKENEDKVKTGEMTEDEMMASIIMFGKVVQYFGGRIDPVTKAGANKQTIGAISRKAEFGRIVFERRVSLAAALRIFAEEEFQRLLDREQGTVDPQVLYQVKWEREHVEYLMSFADRLSGVEHNDEPIFEDAVEPVVLVVRNPDVAQMSRLVADPRVTAVVLDGEYEPKHWAAWVAQEKGVPVLGTMQGTDSIFDAVKNGDIVLVDGMGSQVITNPSTEREAGFERRLEEQAASLEVLAGWGARPAETVDGVPVRITSTLVSFPEKKQIAEINATAGGNVGLFRTEFMYESRMPDEKELANNIFSVASALNGKIRFRAIDRRPGDKNTIFDTLPGNDKAELTWLTETDTGVAALKSLLRATLTAYARLPADKKNIEFFVPMAERRTQIERVLKIMAEVKAELIASKALGEGVDAAALAMPFGVMIETEVPEAELKSIFAMPEISFISIGTRDLQESIKSKAANMKAMLGGMALQDQKKKRKEPVGLVADVTKPLYLGEVKKIVTLAAAAGKDIGLCGVNTSNEGLFLFVNSLDIDNARLPSWSLVSTNIPRMKLFTRAMNRAAIRQRLRGAVDLVNPYSLKVGTNERRMITLLRQTRDAASDIILTSEEFEVAFNRVLVQEGATEAVRRDFDPTTYRHLRSVKAQATGGRVSRARAGQTGFDYSLINGLGRHVVSSLQYAASNGNVGVAFLSRVAQNWIDRVVFGKDTRVTWTIVGAEGHRPGKDPNGTLPVGANLGFGSQRKEMVVLSVETPQGLYTGTGGTVLGRVYADEKSVRSLPDAYMFKVIAAPQLSGIPLTEVIESGRGPGRDGIELERAASDLITRSESILGREPRVAVLLRDRQRGMIETIARTLGIEEGYEAIQSRVAGSPDGHEEFRGPDGATLHVYAYDDWTAGLAVGRENGIDLFLGTGGTPEASMSAVIAKKQGATFAGVIVPQNNQAFSLAERGNLTRGGITNTREIFDQNAMVPGSPDSVAVGVAVLRDFRYGANLDSKVAGPRVKEDGHVEASVLWVAADDVMPVKLTYSTALSAALRKLSKNKDDADLALEVALGWIEFGAYEKAAAIGADWMSRTPLSPQSRRKFEAVKLFAEGGIALTRTKESEEDAPLINSVALYEKALTALEDPEVSQLDGELVLTQRIRRIYYLLRDRSLRRARAAEADQKDALYNKAIEYADKALSHTPRGYETRRRQNAARLDPIINDYQTWEETYWATNATAPSVREKFETVYDLYMSYRAQPGFGDYANALSGAGSDVLVAIVFATVLNTTPIDDQARILRFLNGNPDARAMAAAMNGDAAPDRALFAYSMQAFMAAGLQRRPWQSTALEHLPTDRRVVRPELGQFLDRMEARREAGPVLAELILMATSKADIMPALGNADRRLVYLQDAAQYAEVIETHPRLYGAEPLTLIFEIAVLYEALASASDNPVYTDKARTFSNLTRDGPAFAAFLAGLKDENERRLYSDADVARLNAQRAQFRSESNGSANAPAATNSFLYYLALLWNGVAGPAWRITNLKRALRIGYALEIVIGIALVSSLAMLPWSSQTAFLIGTMPVTGLAVSVFGGLLAFAALHVAAWAALGAMKGGVSPRAALARLGLHTLGFLPYVLFAQALALDPTFSLAPVLLAVLAAVSHAAFDETLSRGRVSLTASQEARYGQILSSLHARESREGTLSRRVDTILPSAAAGVNRDAFQNAFDVAARNAARGPQRSLSDTIDAAMKASAQGPILVFVTASGTPGDELAREAFARSAAEGKDGEPRPVLISVDPDVPNADAVMAAIESVRNANPATPSAALTLGRDVQARDGEYHYEDLFRAFAENLAANPRAAGFTNTRLMREGLAQGRAETGTRIVQINSSGQPFIANADLLALILLIVPIRTTSVLLDMKAVLLAATQA